jgi:uncharacterized alpha-E superfamily protein
MLSRVADAVLWMGRYIERAEHVARVIDVNINLLLDLGVQQDRDARRYWEPLIGVPAAQELFFRLYSQADERTLPEFLTFNVENPNSILSAISRARENARGVREAISSEMWEHLNRTYWLVHSSTSRRLWDEGPHAFYQQIKEAAQAFQGITDATMLRGEEWQFVQLGKYLERADNTSRLLDIKLRILLPDAGEPEESVDAVQWMAVLRSCSAYEAYRRHQLVPLDAWSVSEFLVFSAVFPRSIRFSVGQAAAALDAIGGAGTAGRQARRVMVRLQSSLEYGSLDDLRAEGIHAYLDHLQIRLNRIGEELHAAYFLFEPVLVHGMQSAAQQQAQAQ